MQGDKAKAWSPVFALYKPQKSKDLQKPVSDKRLEVPK